MAEDFNKYFSSTSTHAPEIPLDAFTPLDEGMPVLDSLVLCEDEAYKGLLNLNPSKAPGLGGFPTIVLKSSVRELTPSLCGLFNSSLAKDKLATEWKDALVVLVHNKGKNHAQHGFLQGRSTVTQLLAFYHEIGQSLDKSLQSDIVYLDLAKAFNSLSHQRLLLKLSRYGVSGKLLQWFESYLGERGQQCLVHGFTLVALQFHQESLRAVSSVLLPVIQNRITLFADDSKCSNVIESLQDYESFQKEVDSLHGWTDNWHLKFNISKCQVRTVTLMRHLFSLRLKVKQQFT